MDADSHHLVILKLYKFNNFDEICHGALSQPTEPHQPIKFQDFKITVCRKSATTHQNCGFILSLKPGGILD